MLAGARLGEEASTKTQPWLTIRSLLCSNIVLNRLEGAKMEFELRLPTLENKTRPRMFQKA